MENKKDFYSSLFFLILGVVYFFASFEIKKITSTTVDGAFIPQLLSVIMVVISLFLTISSYVKLKRDPEKNSVSVMNELKSHIGKKTVWTLVVLFAYVILLGQVGFVVTTIVYLITQILILEGAVNKKTMFRSVLVSLIATISVYYIFEKALQVLLPHGILF